MAFAFRYCLNLQRLFLTSNQTELTVGDLLESVVVEIVFELEVDIFAMLRVFRIVKVMRGNEDVFHEVLGDSVVCHCGCELILNEELL